MPSTINGIGTWYYGKKNLQERSGVCSHCGRHAKLSNYDTRLYVVVFFIPILPLGKKHIYGQCNLCSYHHAVDPKSWETGREESIAEGMKAMRENPADPAAAIKLYQAYFTFDQLAEADKMIDHLKENFHSNFDVQMFLGVTLENRGRVAESSVCFRQALAIDPKHNAAHYAVGMILIKEDKLNDAATMLAPLTQDDDQCDASAAYALAEAYKKANRHAEAFALIKVMVQRFPHLKKDPLFKKFVREVEKVLGNQKPILEPVPWHHSPWMLVPITGMLVLGVACYSIYLSYHRTVYIVSGSSIPVTVAVQGGPTVTVNSSRHEAIKIPEGVHTVTYSGGAQGSTTLTLTGNFFTRMASKDFVCLNPGETAVLLWEQTTYSKSPTKGSHTYRLAFGQPVIRMPDIDLPFEKFPSSISTKSSSEVRRRVELLSVDREALFYSLYEDGRIDEALNLAEWYLRLNPDHLDFVESYIAMAPKTQAERARRFATERCARRPVEIEWHKAHQDLSTTLQERVALSAEYDGLLAKDPENPDLLYLRSRLLTSGAMATPLLKQALAKNPKHSHAISSLCFHAVHRTNWEEAWPLAQHVIADRPLLVRRSYLECAHGARRLKELEMLLKGEIQQNARAQESTEELCRLLAAQGRLPEANKLANDFEAGANKNGHSGEVAFKQPQAIVQYVSADFATLKTHAKMSGVPAIWKTIAAVETDDLVQLDTLTRGKPARGTDMLLYALVFKAGGKTELADKWRESALKTLGSVKEEGAAIQQWLNSTTGPSVGSVIDLNLTLREQSIVLAALADRYPDQRSEYVAALERANVFPEFPYHWLKRFARKVSEK